jgi:hypothetical protein
MAHVPVRVIRCTVSLVVRIPARNTLTGEHSELKVKSEKADVILEGLPKAQAV